VALKGLARRLEVRLVLAGVRGVGLHQLRLLPPVRVVVEADLLAVAQPLLNVLAPLDLAADRLEDLAVDHLPEHLHLLPHLVVRRAAERVRRLFERGEVVGVEVLGERARRLHHPVDVAHVRIGVLVELA
jgi:hypothetical protein